MADDHITSRLRDWLVRMFVRAINGISTEQDRADVLVWLERSRDVVASDVPAKDKFRDLYALTSARRCVVAVANGVAEAVKNYRSADLPLAVKVAVPLTLLASPFLGGQAAGIAALGTGVGLPVLLLLFLGSAGLTAIIEAVVVNPAARGAVGDATEVIIREEMLRRDRLKRAMAEDVVEPLRAEIPPEDAAIRDALLAMEPFAFERHVMGFFGADAFEVVRVTPKSGDQGIDGYAERRGGGIVVVQCKRHAPGNVVGSPDIQAFKGAIEDAEADHGYFVTTSGFSAPARESAAKSSRVSLVDMDGLVGWHKASPKL